MMPADLLSATLLIIGGIFFLAGTLGLLRFPDVYTRLHALTKADNVGLGLVVMGLAMQVETWATVGKLLLIWVLVLLAGASVAYMGGPLRSVLFFDDYSVVRLGPPP